MKKIILFAIMAIIVAACGNNKEQMKKNAEENLRMTISGAQNLQILQISEPDSAFGVNYFTDKELQEFVNIMAKCSDIIMKETDNMEKFDPENLYVIKLADRQMQATTELRNIFSNRNKEPFSGWKMKIDYSYTDGEKTPIKAERWFFFDRKGQSIYKTMEIPLP